MLSRVVHVGLLALALVGAQPAAAEQGFERRVVKTDRPVGVTFSQALSRRVGRTPTAVESVRWVPTSGNPARGVRVTYTDLVVERVRFETPADAQAFVASANLQGDGERAFEVNGEQVILLSGVALDEDTVAGFAEAAWLGKPAPAKLQRRYLEPKPKQVTTTRTVTHQRRNGLGRLVAHHFEGQQLDAGTLQSTVSSSEPGSDEQTPAATGTYKDVQQSVFGNCWFLSTLAAGVHTGKIDDAYLAAAGYDPQQTYEPAANGANYVNFLAEKHGTNRERGSYTERAFKLLWGKEATRIEFSVKNVVNVIRTARDANKYPTVVARDGVAFSAGHAMAVVGYDGSSFPGKLTLYDQARDFEFVVDLSQGRDYGILDRMYQLK